MNQDFESAYGRYLSGAMDPEERRAFEDRILADPGLAEEVFADQQIEAALASARRRTGGQGLWNWAVPLAAAIAMFLVARGVDVPGPGDEARFRGGSALVELVEPRGTLQAPPTLFVWTSAPGAARYRVEILDPSGGAGLRRVTTDTFLVPAGELPAAGAWSVVALDDLGAAMTRSAPVRYEVVPPR